jgi:hypothetical protein
MWYNILDRFLFQLTGASRTQFLKGYVLKFGQETKVLLKRELKVQLRNKLGLQLRFAQVCRSYLN